MLGASDDFKHRRAVQRFWRGGADRPPTRPASPSALRRRRRWRLSRRPAVRGDAEVANLLGVLALLTPPDQAERTQVVRAAGAAFRRAIVLDPSIDDAKFNLENVLRLEADLRRRGQGGGGSAGQQGTDYGGAAVSRRGSGY